jgi:hypothetical protein
MSNRLEQSRQVSNGMAEVGVHLDHDRGAPGGHVAEAVYVRPSQALLGFAVKDRNVGPLCGQLIGDGARPVGRVVVHDQHVRIRHRGQDRLGDRPHIVDLVVCREHKPDTRHRRRHTISPPQLTDGERWAAGFQSADSTAGAGWLTMARPRLTRTL